MLMVDVCSGLEGACQAMKENGWDVVTVDNDPKFSPTVLADIRSWSWKGNRPDLMWFSPPCTEFAREFMPWCKTGKTPDLSIYQACLRIIEETNPRFWIIENVKGAIRYFGKPSAIFGAFYLWGFFPHLGRVRLNYRKKESYSSSRPEERAKIPYELSRAVALAVENTQTLFDWNQENHDGYSQPLFLQSH